MLTVIGPAWTRTYRVLWMLGELGLGYEHHPHPPRSGEVFERNPLGRVPILVDGDLTISDSTVILHYLGDKMGRFTATRDTRERLAQDAITQFLLDSLDALLWTAARHSYVLPEDRRVPAALDSLPWEIAETEERVARLLGDGPFLMGERFTVPDIIAGHCGRWARKTGLGGRTGAFSDYVDRLLARPVPARLDGVA